MPTGNTFNEYRPYTVTNRTTDLLRGPLDVEATGPLDVTAAPANMNVFDFDYTPYIPNTVTANWIDTFTTKYVTEDYIETLLHKIYTIIEEHTQIDISEEEFLKILEE